MGCLYENPQSARAEGRSEEQRKAIYAKNVIKKPILIKALV